MGDPLGLIQGHRPEQRRPGLGRGSRCRDFPAGSLRAPRRPAHSYRGSRERSRPRSPLARSSSASLNGPSSRIRRHSARMRAMDCATRAFSVATLPEDHPGMPERDELGRHSVSQPALYANPPCISRPRNPPPPRTSLTRRAAYQSGSRPVSGRLAWKVTALCGTGRRVISTPPFSAGLVSATGGSPAAGRRAAEHLID